MEDYLPKTKSIGITSNSLGIAQKRAMKNLFAFGFFLLSVMTTQTLYAQPNTPAGFVANPSSGPGEVFLACGPNDVGMNDIVYKLFYSETASAPADPLTATEYIFGTTGGDGNGTAAFGFDIAGLVLNTDYTFWLYQYNTVTMMYSASPATATQVSGGGGPPATPVGFVANPATGSGRVFLACGPNDVGANNIVYKLYYSQTASAPGDPLLATEHIFGTIGGDGGGTAAFGFNIEGLTPTIDYTFWLYQYNTVTMEFSVNPSIRTQVASGTTVPVIWSGDVDASLIDDKDIVIKWAVTQEINNDKFIVEHATNGRNFSALQEIKGAGTSSSYQFYSFIHTKPSYGFNYYRIKQVDFDGRTDHSNVANVWYTADDKVDIYPNPATSEVNVRSEREMKLSLKDFYGRQLMRFSISEGDNKIALDGIPQGIYILEFEDGRVERLVKK